MENTNIKLKEHLFANPDKVYFSIAEASEIIGETQSLIRFWEKHFPKLKPKKNKRGVRFYSKNEIEYLCHIHYLVKERGYKLEGARAVLDENEMKTKKNYALIQTLEKVKALLKEIKASI